MNCLHSDIFVLAESKIIHLIKDDWHKKYNTSATPSEIESRLKLAETQTRILIIATDMILEYCKEIHLVSRLKLFYKITLTYKATALSVAIFFIIVFLCGNIFSGILDVLQ